MVTSEQAPRDAAALAERYGLYNTTARPALRTYIDSLWQRRYFLWTYASARGASRYSASRLGQLWQVLTPLLNVAIYFFLFGVLLQTSRGVDNFLGFLVVGVFVFTFTQRALTNGAKAINGNLGIIRALHFPRAVLPMSFVLVELKQLMISLLLLVPIIPITGAIYGTGDTITLSWLLIFPAIALQLLFNLGVGLFVARIGAFQPDVNQLVPFVARLWFYASGVIYSIDHFGSAIGAVPYHILQFNPGAVFLDLYRNQILASHDPLNLPLGLNTWAVAAAWAVLAFVGGFLYFWRREEAYGRG